MRFLFVTTCAPRPGNQMKGLFVHQMAKSLLELGHRVDILVPVRVFPSRQLMKSALNPAGGRLMKEFNSWINNIKGTGSEFQKDGVDYFYKRFTSSPVTSKSAGDCARFIKIRNGWLSSFLKERAYDFVLGHFMETVPLVNYLSEGFGSGSAVYIHEDVSDYKKRMDERLIRAFLLGARTLVTNSTRSRSVIASFTSEPEKIRIVYLGIDKIFLNSKNRGSNRSGRLKLVCVSRFVERKNQERLIYAIRQWNATVDLKLSLELVGDNSPSRERLERLTASLGLTDSITFTDAADLKTIHDRLNRADAFIFPSYYESFGIALIEAASQGLPILTTPDVGAAHELERMGLSIIRFAPDSVDSVIDALRRLKDNYEMYRNGALALRETVISAFSWKTTASEIASLATPAEGSTP